MTLAQVGRRFTGDEGLRFGIDAGATHTTGKILDSANNTLWAGDAGPINHLAGVPGEARMTRTLSALAAPIPQPLRGRIRMISVGLSGYGIPGKADFCRTLLKDLFPLAAVWITSDLIAAAWACTRGNDGLILLCGTGSAALGFKAERVVRFGGRGSQFSDEGSAYAIATDAVRRALKSAEGRDLPTVLTQTLARSVDVETIGHVPGRVFAESWDAGKVAQLARVVGFAAEEGDLVAISVLRRAGGHLGGLAVAAIREIGIDAPVFMVGRGWLVSPILRKTAEQILHRRLGAPIRLTKTSNDATLGAVLWASRAEKESAASK